jgi:tetratricopeptide (TPR) repeat protein
MARRILLGTGMLALLLATAWLSRDAWRLLLHEDAHDPVSAVRIARDAGHVQLTLGDALFEQQRLEDARAVYERAAALYAQSVHDYNTALALDRVGNALYRLGRMEAAAEQYRRALAIFERLGEREQQVGTGESLGDVAFVLGRYDQARAYYESAWAAAGAGGAREVQRLMRIKQADAERAAQAFSLAAVHYDEVLSDPSAGPRAKALALEGHVRIADAQGRRDDAIRLAQTAARAFEQVQDPGDRARMLLLYGTLLGDAGRYRDARGRLAEAARLYARADDLAQYGLALTRLAAAELSAGDRAGARRTFGDAARAYDEAGDTSRASALRQLADALAPRSPGP